MLRFEECRMTSCSKLYSQKISHVTIVVNKARERMIICFHKTFHVPHLFHICCQFKCYKICNMQNKSATYRYKRKCGRLFTLHYFNYSCGDSKYTASLLYGSLIQGFFCYMVYFLPVRNGMSFHTKEYF